MSGYIGTQENWCLLKVSSNPTFDISSKIFFYPSLTPLSVQCLKCDETLCFVFDINLKKQIKTDLLLLLITFKLSEFQRLDRLSRPLFSSSFWFESCIWHILYTSFDNSSAGLICRMMSSISAWKKKKIIAFSVTLHILFKMNLEIEEPERRKIWSF